jgi:hypothetical protein
MGIRLGVIEYSRPLQPATADDVRQILAVAGKDVVRLAWSSLNPDKDGNIKRDALAVWLCEFFNMERNEGHGSKCIQILEGMGLLHGSSSWLRPEFRL